MKKFLLLSAGLMIAGAAIAQNEVIREQPEGTLRTFHGYSYATEVTWGYSNEDHYDGLARQVVFSDNGDVWFKNPISKLSTDSWIKGTLQDGIITVELPQLIDVEEEDGEVDKWYVQRFKGTKTYDEEWDVEDIEWEVDTEKSYITFTYTGDQIIQTDKDEDLVKLGLMLNDQHMYYGDRNIVYTAVDEKAATLPEGIVMEKWSLKYNGLYALQMSVGIDGNDMYFQGFWPEFPEAVVKGEIAGDKVNIPSKQYLGFLSTASGDGFYTYMMNSKVVPSMVDYYITSEEPMVLNYDAENKTMTPSEEKRALVVRSGKTCGIEDYEYSVRLSLRNPLFSKIEKIEKLTTPTINRVNRDYEYGWGYLETTILSEDIAGNALDLNQLTYSIWLDNEKLEFDPELDFNGQMKYKYLDEPTVDLPYTFDNDSGIKTIGSLAEKYIFFCNLGFDEIGVQASYYDDISEQMLYSDKVYINPETKEIRIEEAGSSAINNAMADAEIADIAFYDLNGTRIDAPAKGIYVKVITYTDGTFKTFKKIGR